MTVIPNLSQLPFVFLSESDQLPDHSGIYFVIDSDNKVLYIGQTKSLVKRWKGHHRKHQFLQITEKSFIKIAWLICAVEDLTSAESYLINYYRPLYNQTKIINPELIPSEVVLRELLQQIKPLIVIVGIKQATPNNLLTVYINYNYENSGKNGCAQKIKRFQKENREKKTNLNIKQIKFGEYRTHNTRPGSREHKVISRLKSSYNNHWIIPCNGVLIDITPLDEQTFQFLRNPQNSKLKPLAGIKIRSTIDNITDASLSPMINDPIPLLWTE